MGQREYDIIFSGALVVGRDPAQVKSDLAKLFKTDAAGIERLFCGQPVIIKKGVDQQTAVKYQTVMEKAGAVCEIRARAPSAVSASPSVDSIGQATIAPPGAILTVPKEVKSPVFDLSGMSMAEAGMDIVEDFGANVAAPLFDLSALSVAPSGSELTEVRQAVQTLFPNFDGLSVADPGSILGPGALLVAVAVPDISGITLAPPGADMIRPEEAKPSPRPPDIDKSVFSLVATDDSDR